MTVGTQHQRQLLIFIVCGFVELGSVSASCLSSTDGKHAVFMSFFVYISLSCYIANVASHQALYGR